MGFISGFKWFRKRTLNIICHIKGSIAKTCLDDVHRHEKLCTSLYVIIEILTYITREKERGNLDCSFEKSKKSSETLFR